VTARDDVLRRMRSALADTPAHRGIRREYRVDFGQPAGSDDVIGRFVTRLEDYKARVHLTSSIEDQLATVVVGARTAVIPPRLPSSWRAALEASIETLRVDGRPAHLDAAQLDDVGVVVTACRVAIAETGTIVLDAEPDQGRRVLSLVPDHHVVVVFAEQVVASVPEALARLDAGRPLTFISGPSATSDIEFNRVEGVHGPRRLDVIVVADGARRSVTSPPWRSAGGVGRTQRPEPT
jgi:L-lactate dehydrogenase complex protein LldG